MMSSASNGEEEIVKFIRKQQLLKFKKEYLIHQLKIQVFRYHYKDNFIKLENLDGKMDKYNLKFVVSNYFY